MKSMFIAQIQAKLPGSVEGEMISSSGRWRGELGLLQGGPIWMRLFGWEEFFKIEKWITGGVWAIYSTNGREAQHW